MNPFFEKLKDEKLCSSLSQIKSMAEKEGLSLDEFIELVLPVLNADVKLTEQDVKDYLTVKSHELSNEDLGNVSGGCGGNPCCDTWNEHCLCNSVYGY